MVHLVALEYFEDYHQFEAFIQCVQSKGACNKTSGNCCSTSLSKFLNGKLLLLTREGIPGELPATNQECSSLGRGVHAAKFSSLATRPLESSTREEALGEESDKDVADEGLGGGSNEESSTESDRGLDEESEKDLDKESENGMDRESGDKSKDKSEAGSGPGDEDPEPLAKIIAEHFSPLLAPLDPTTPWNNRAANYTTHNTPIMFAHSDIPIPANIKIAIFNFLQWTQKLGAFKGDQLSHEFYKAWHSLISISLVFSPQQNQSIKVALLIWITSLFPGHSFKIPSKSTLNRVLTTLADMKRDDIPVGHWAATTFCRKFNPKPTQSQTQSQTEPQTEQTPTKPEPTKPKTKKSKKQAKPQTEQTPTMPEPIKPKTKKSTKQAKPAKATEAPADSG